MPECRLVRGPADIEIVPWGEGDLELLTALVGDPAMMEHLGGPESAERIADRQQRYLRPGSGSYKIVDVASGEGAGWVGVWDREWRGEDVLETGWSVLPAFQGRGIAVQATGQLLERVRAEGERRPVHAFPAVDNAPSNAICRRLGFTLLGPRDFEYPPGHLLRCNDWRLELS